MQSVKQWIFKVKTRQRMFDRFSGRFYSHGLQANHASTSPKIRSAEYSSTLRDAAKYTKSKTFIHMRAGNGELDMCFKKFARWFYSAPP